MGLVGLPALGGKGRMHLSAETIHDEVDGLKMPKEKILNFLYRGNSFFFSRKEFEFFYIKETVFFFHKGFVFKINLLTNDGGRRRLGRGQCTGRPCGDQ